MNPFEAYTAAYDAWFDLHPHAYHAELEAIRSLMPATFDAALEIGVGTGRFAVPLGISTGIEPSATMRALAVDRGVQAIEGVAESLPFSDEAFEVILMVTTLCYLDNVQSSFREAYRVAKNGGAFIVAFIDAASPIGRQYLEKQDRSRFYKDAHFYAAAEVGMYMRDAGFEDLEIRQTIFQDPAAMSIPSPVRSGSGDGVFVVMKGLKPIG